ncbi:hypothetical protein CC2G_009628 [Coprinopsis cinerea AmutBmut pab1-1]|nr:hypothetical protein CC2G_009628 [Coprinopsis cinerea AmutBmut pab1-1]
MYAASMERILSQDRESRQLAEKVLLWLAFAQGPLSTQDLRYALAIHSETFDFDPSRMPDEESIVSVCCGLVEKHQETNAFRLIHFTAKDALGPLLLKDQSNPHVFITNALIHRLISSGIIDSGRKLTWPHEFRKICEQHPLLQYAHKFLGFHIDRCDLPQVFDAVKDFLLGCRDSRQRNGQRRAHRIDYSFNQRS